MPDQPAFTADDWRYVQKRLVEVQESIRRKGATIHRPLEIHPPVPQEQIEDFSRRTKLSLPSDLIDLLTRFTGGWDLSWCLAKAGQDREWLNPPRGACLSRFSGTPFLGISSQPTAYDRSSVTLYDRFRELQDFFDEWGPDDPRSTEILRNSLPLFPDDGEGDWVVLRLDVDPCEVVHADHEMGWMIQPDDILARGFTGFVRCWSELGFPQPPFDPSPLLLDDPSNSAAHEKKARWLDWLSEP